jgi:hypothetical protein
MTKNYGSASRAREIARLFAVWKHACDTRDIPTMNIAMRAINAAVAGKTPREADAAAIVRFAAR